MPQSSVQISGRHSATWATRSVAPAMSVPLRIERQRAFDIAENQVAAHAGGQVQDHIDIGRADAVGDFLVETLRRARRAGFGIAHMAMDDRRSGLGGIDGRSRDLLGESSAHGAICAVSPAPVTAQVMKTSRFIAQWHVNASLVLGGHYAPRWTSAALHFRMCIYTLSEHQAGDGRMLAADRRNR